MLQTKKPRRCHKIRQIEEGGLEQPGHECKDFTILKTIIVNWADFA